MANYVYDENATIVGRYRSQTDANTAAAAVTGYTAYVGDVTRDLTIGQKVTTTAGQSLPPVVDSTTAAARLTEHWKYKLFEAWNIYVNPVIPTSRQTWWLNLDTAATSEAALKATDRWALHQIALGDLIADRSWGTRTTDTQRQTAIDHIVNIISTLGKTWYGVMLADTGEDRTRWSVVSTESTGGGSPVSAPIYSDIIESAAELAPRNPDGDYRLMHSAHIPVGFTPDTPTLR